MNKESEPMIRGKGAFEPTLSIYGYSNTINIGQNLVRILGMPSYISLRVNKSMDSILVTPCNEKEIMSFKVPERFLKDDNCFFRIVSKRFVSSVISKNNLNPKQAYMMCGTYVERINGVIFGIAGSIPRKGRNEKWTET